MFAIKISPVSVSFLEIDKNLVGKLVVKSGGRKKIEKEENWKEFATGFIKHQHVAFAIPDSQVFLYRFEVKNDIARDVLHTTIINKVKEIIPDHFDNLLYDYMVFKNEKQSLQHIIFIAVQYQTLLPIYELWKQEEGKSLIVISQSLAQFEVLRRSIETEETILYIDAGDFSSSLTFFDTSGPVLSVADPVVNKSLSTEIQKVVSFFNEKYSHNISSIIVGGEKEDLLSLEELSSTTNIPVIKSDTIFHDAILELGIHFAPAEKNPEKYITPLGLGMTSFQKEQLNLAKKENLLLLDTHLKNHAAPSDNRLIIPPADTTKQPKASYPELKTSRKENKKRPPLLIAITILSILIILSYFYISSQKYSQKPVVKKTEQLLPSSTPTPELKRADVSIQIQNGSGEKGAATNAESVLKKIGYITIETKNADSFDYTDITLKLKDDKNRFKEMLLSDLKKNFEKKITVETLNTDITFDAVIIIGK